MSNHKLSRRLLADSLSEINPQDSHKLSRRLLEDSVEDMKKSERPIDRILAETRQRLANVKHHQSQPPKSALYPTRGKDNGNRILISPDLKQEGKWRKTHFWPGEEPTGHVEGLSYPEAIRHAHESGADLDNPIPDFDKSELQKGSLQRRTPFNPLKDQPSNEQMENMNLWQDNGSGDRRNRNAITKDTGNVRDRFLHKLSAKTKARQSPSGGREFLLHRGYDQFDPMEVDNTHVSSNENSSWTPKHSVASIFAEDGGALSKPSIASAWIHENNILTIPNQYGNTVSGASKRDKNNYSSEHEVIVGPHISEKVNFKPTRIDEVNPDLNARITQRGQKGYAHFQEPKAVLNQRRMGKSEPKLYQKKWHNMSYNDKKAHFAREAREKKDLNKPSMEETIKNSVASVLESRKNKEPIKKSIDPLKKPFSSEAQKRFAYANPEKFGGKKGLKHWQDVTPKNIPERVAKAQFEHYSPQSGLTTISPSKQGSGVDARTRGRSTEVPHSFYYDAGTAPENVVKDQAKSKYLINLPNHAKIYDLGLDPEQHIQKLKDQALNRQVNAGHVTMDEIHHHLKNNGYHGFRNTQHPTLHNVVGLYRDQPVESEEPI